MDFGRRVAFTGEDMDQIIETAIFASSIVNSEPNTGTFNSETI